MRRVPVLLAWLLVLVTSAAILVLEVIVNRLVAPYVGLSLETYTTAIGAALASISMGTVLGGRLADSVDPRRWLGPVTIAGGGLVLLSRPVVDAIGPSMRGRGASGTMVLVCAAIVVPSLVLSMVPPGVVKLQLRTLAETGRTVGALSALGTLGALLGTFLTGFVLLAHLSAGTILVSTAVVVLVTGLLTAVLVSRSRGVVALVLLLSAPAGVWALAGDGPCDVQTRYYCVRIDVDPVRATGRVLVLDDGDHSYVDLVDPRFLGFRYSQRMADVLATRAAGPLRALHIGGGGFTLPRYLDAVRPGSRNTVVEIDPALEGIARRSLGLSLVSPALEVVAEDGRTHVAGEGTDEYDLVIGDAFGREAVPWHLTTAEMKAEIRRVLAPGGVYLLNMIDGPRGRFARAEAATLRAVFPHVVMLAPVETMRGLRGGNYVFAASDEPFDVSRLLRLAASRGEPEGVADEMRVAQFASRATVLTDDYAPVDQLISTAV
jgi:spermidine synthase